MKEHAWAKHLTSPPERGVGALSNTVELGYVISGLQALVMYFNCLTLLIHENRNTDHLHIGNKFQQASQDICLANNIVLSILR